MTVTVASVVTVIVACGQELGSGRKEPASFRDGEADSTIVWVEGSLVMTTVE